jgi:hypothetical protein
LKAKKQKEQKKMARPKSTQNQPKINPKVKWMTCTVSSRFPSLSTKEKKEGERVTSIRSLGSSSLH